MMPSSAVRTFADPDHYAASIRGAGAELTITGFGQFAAEIITVGLGQLSMQRFFDNLPRISHSTDFAGQATISFRTQPGPSLQRSGVEMLPSNIIRCSNGKSFFRRSAGLASFGTISLPVKEMAAVSAIAGCDLTPPIDALSVIPPPAAIAKLQRLHAAAGQLAADAPAVIAQPEAARGLEQALILAMVRCLGTGDAGEDRAALRQHAIILHRFRRALEEKPDQAVFIPELCTAIGVSERTLRLCCQEQLGVSPKRYLLLRRMHLAQRDLRESAPTATTVTEIATRYGFWQFGRFAGTYKLLFGELPSATLARPHD
jgi:AraC-like DNA-binding protein